MTDVHLLLLADTTASDWTSLLPALVAVSLAVVLRSVLPALFLAVCCGVALSLPEDSGWWVRSGEALLLTVTQTLPRAIVPEDGSASHVQILLFTLFLGSLVGVMSASGGTRAIVQALTPLTRSRRGGMVATWFLGLVIFFDDYANSLLIGSTMRPVTDRLRISREKLAFLVDATAAPVAGLAIVSTWVGFEVGLIEDAFARLAAENPRVNVTVDGYGTFLATLPYRFYPILILAFVLMIAWSVRDFGAMLRAERRALDGPGPSPAEASGPVNRSAPAAGSVWSAIVPLLALFAGLIIGFYWTGRAATDAEVTSLREVIANADSNRVLLASSFLASIVAVVMGVCTGGLSFPEAMEAWIEGAKGMLLGCCVLVLAWSIATVCDGDHLNTGGYLVESTRGWLQPRWLPTVAFVLSGAVAFATGSSWTTMGLVIPLVIEVTFGLLIVDEAGGLAMAAGIDRHPLMLASIGGVLAGSIFGDHCSPISDTTVLSSIAAGCDHVSHVTTQMPYALVVGLVCVVCGCVPSGFGVPWQVTLPLGVVACALVVRYGGRPVGEGSKSADFAEPPVVGPVSKAEREATQAP